MNEAAPRTVTLQPHPLVTLSEPVRRGMWAPEPFGLPFFAAGPERVDSSEYYIEDDEE